MTEGAAAAAAGEPGTDAGKAMAVRTEPATVAPATGSAAAVPAIPAGAAAAAAEAVVPVSAICAAN